MVEASGMLNHLLVRSGIICVPFHTTVRYVELNTTDCPAGSDPVVVTRYDVPSYSIPGFSQGPVMVATHGASRVPAFVTVALAARGCEPKVTGNVNGGTRVPLAAVLANDVVVEG